MRIHRNEFKVAVQSLLWTGATISHNTKYVGKLGTVEPVRYTRIPALIGSITLRGNLLLTILQNVDCQSDPSPANYALEWARQI